MIDMRIFTVLLLVGLIIAISLAYCITVGMQSLNQNTETNTRIVIGPVPFDKIAEEVSIDVVVKQ